MDRDGMVWFLVAFLALAFGNAIGAVHMFRGNVLVVMVGVFLMVASFQLMHYGEHGEGMVDFQQLGAAGSDGSSITQWAVTVSLLVVTIYLIAQGFTIGAVATRQTFTLMDMVLCGGCVVFGYVTGHMAIHGVPL